MQDGTRHSAEPVSKPTNTPLHSPPVLPFCYSALICRMRRFAYCKVVLATSLVWVMLDMFILLYFSECNKCDDKKERGLPGRSGESEVLCTQ